MCENLCNIGKLAFNGVCMIDLAPCLGDLCEHFIYDDRDEEDYCYRCGVSLEPLGYFRCRKCDNLFCLDCESDRESLCVGCESA